MRFLKILSIKLIDSFEVSKNIIKNMKANRVKPALSARFSKNLLELLKKNKNSIFLGNSEVYFYIKSKHRFKISLGTKISVCKNQCINFSDYLLIL